ncbi:Aldo/keto reductase [Cladochytrium replicatum]|nr:Aldo/keto reductase [Cladochytrium replicatum]
MLSICEWVLNRTMTFGKVSARVTDKEEVKKILDVFHSHGGIELDTARMYCAGTTEEVLGEMAVQTTEPFYSIATKAYPFSPGMHRPDKLREQFMASLKALNTQQVDIFYLHAPDGATPFEDTLREVNELYKEGHFKELGLSNYAAWQVMDIYWICKTNGYVLPTLYQGMYNGLTRDVEKELFPCLRKLGLRFYAYNPLAGGLLSGVYRFDSIIDGGARFDPNTSQGAMYRQRYWDDTYFNAIETLKVACEKDGITLVSAAHRWLIHHSFLDASKGDGIICGASSLKHAHENFGACEEGPLPEGVLAAFDEGWAKTKAIAQNYFRWITTDRV